MKCPNCESNLSIDTADIFNQTSTFFCKFCHYFAVFNEYAIDEDDISYIYAPKYTPNNNNNSNRSNHILKSSKPFRFTR